nr:hypothetical protein [Bacillus sp. V3B]
MNKHNTIFTLIQNFLSEAELQAILTEFNYVDSARKCTVSTLISYLIGAATNRWKSLRHAADVVGLAWDLFRLIIHHFQNI